MRKDRIRSDLFLYFFINNSVVTFLEFFGAKLSPSQRRWKARSNPFNTAGELRNNEGGITDIQFEPDESRTHDPSLNTKVELLRLNKASNIVLNKNDVIYICDKYNITNLKQVKTRQLSNMPISINYNPQTGQYYLQRNE